MFRYLAITVAMTAANLTYGQAEFEIAYAFNGGDEVVRVQDEPFALNVDSGLAAPTQQSLFLRFPFAENRTLGLVEVEGEFVFEGTEPQQFESVGRVAVEFDDLIFTSPGTEPVSVDLFVYPGSSLIGSTRQIPEGFVYESHYRITLAGQSRQGTIRLTWPTSVPWREYTGFLEGYVTGVPISADAFQVPVNEPVALRFEFIRSVIVPPVMRMNVEFGTTSKGRRGAGFHTEPWFAPDVFRLPSGVRVDSFQAGIRDNRFVLCLPDLDADGGLTIFDFLAFQNLFDAGDTTADFDGDGDLTLFDFLAFQNAFDTGCP